MKHLKIGIIGTGFGGKVHAKLFNHHPHIEVTSIATVTGKDIELIKNTTGEKNIYINWKEMLVNEHLDLVSITSVPSHHKEMVLDSLKRKIPVFCEKPLATNMRETSIMLKLQRQVNVSGYINFEWRFLPARLKVKELLEKGEIGKIIHVRYSVNVPMYLTSIPTKKAGLIKRKREVCWEV